ncbi:MAG: replication-associated recombination protein A [Schleiferiaceae bacterium]|jgi:putative ATPase|nr:replication-associated recombination protein A [Schleiferiaceae bacterium]
MQAPLAERLRPQKLEDYIGQEHLVGPNGFLRRAIEAKIIPSLILWGPPGVGKTTLARLLAKEAGVPMYSLSAINSGVKDIREVITKAKEGNLFQQKRPLLFIDEIHRFSKSQQDSLLGAVEDGTITLIGATTENPSFEVISALLSRAQVYTLKPLDKTQLDQLLENALSHDDWLKNKNIKLAEKEALMRFSGGDARKLLNILELIANNESGSEIIITNEMVQEKLQDKLALYDKNGEQHYDIISAFIKSIRGSDPNGAVYWLARMIEGGEDIKFIARRLVILASEDIGNANPTALVMANAAFDAVSKIGFPEGRIILAQCTTYLASSAKSNASYEAINLAQQAVRDHGDLEVPLHIRNAPTKLMKELGYGKEYAYSHSYEGNFKAQEYLPEKLSGTRFYSPGNNDRENALRRSLKQKWKNKYGY